MSGKVNILDKLINEGKLMKRESWNCYWEWDSVTKSILVHHADGNIINSREIDDTEFILRNLMYNDWVEATLSNCEVLDLEFKRQYRLVMGGDLKPLNARHLSSTKFLMKEVKSLITNHDSVDDINIDNIIVRTHIYHLSRAIVCVLGLIGDREVAGFASDVTGTKSVEDIKKLAEENARDNVREYMMNQLNF